MGVLNSITEIAKETIWPTRCAICDTPGDFLCKSCISKLDFIDSCKACPRCGAPYSKNQCTECNDVMIKANGADGFPLDQLRHCVAFNDEPLRIIKVYKDGNERRLASFISKMMASYIEPSWVEENAVLTYIPATKDAVQRRGFDHMEEIATGIAHMSELDLISIFERPSSSDQRELGRADRLLNMEQRLKVSPKPRIINEVDNSCDRPLKERPIIVADDVCTSGATLYAACNALRSEGWKKTYGLTFGRVLD